MDAVKNLTAGMIKEDAPEIKIGTTVRVHVKIREGERERIQVFEGTVIAKNNSGIAETFTVRVEFVDLAGTANNPTMNKSVEFDLIVTATQATAD